MPRARCNGIEIEYETQGDPAAPPLLLIMGLGAQLIRWPAPFCDALERGGHHVIRYDNRDVGLSTKMSGKAPLVSAVLRSLLGAEPAPLPYTLADMAGDAAGLLDALGLRSAHVVGVSMGGMIGQVLCALHPDRVRSFTSIMSSSGDPRLPGPRWDVRLRMMRTAPQDDPEARVRRLAGMLQRISSPGYPRSAAELHAQASREVHRSDHPQGLLRQLGAVIGSPSRLQLLSRIKAPTLIIHGAADPLVPVAAAEDLRRRIPGSVLEIITGMGHDLPPALVPRLTGRILDHVARAEAGPHAARA